ncbi:hypothetical protein GTP46_18520 [Duganella sp. FT135W]|uniref:Uncharacterized protein n=1 Tax=Duganella flavida TaxID=2692175 RepID=A0A6L8KFS3_9BURK|nr:hypothetical protein [Duganella flavida]MYM24634.1 hypothetical protein [Duganella flavida]
MLVFSSLAGHIFFPLSLSFSFYLFLSLGQERERRVQKREKETKRERQKRKPPAKDLADTSPPYVLRKTPPAPAPVAAPLLVTPSASAPINHYYAELFKKISTTESAEFLLQHAAHPTCYMREVVLKRIVELALPELLPVVVERLNDWVPQVQRAARTALMTLLPFLPASQLLAAMPMILRWHSAGRADYAGWLEKFELTLIRAGTVCQPGARIARQFLPFCSRLHFGAIRAVALRMLLDMEGDSLSKITSARSA